MRPQKHIPNNWCKLMISYVQLNQIEPLNQKRKNLKINTSKQKKNHKQEKKKRFVELFLLKKIEHYVYLKD